LVKFCRKQAAIAGVRKTAKPAIGMGCAAPYFLQTSAHRRLEEFMETPDSGDDLGHFIDFLCQREIVYAFKLNPSRPDIGNRDA